MPTDALTVHGGNPGWWTRHSLLAAQPLTNSQAVAQHRRQAHHARANRRATSAANPAGAHLDSHQFRAGPPKSKSNCQSQRAAASSPSRSDAIPPPRLPLAALARASRRAWRRAHGVLPADHYIANPERYRIIGAGPHWRLRAAKAAWLVLGIPPTRPETATATSSAWVTRSIRKAFPFTRSGASPKNRALGR